MLSHLRPRRASTSSGAVSVVAGGAMPIRRWPERRGIVLGAAAVLFLGIFALRMATADAGTGVGLLLVIPTALVALELGFGAGLAAAAVAIGLVLVWAMTTDADVGAEGVLTRAGVFLLVGALAGRFSDRMREAAVRQQRLMQSGLALARLRDAGEIAQIVAGWARETVAAKGTRVVLLDGRSGQDGAVGPRPVRIPVEVRGERVGELAIEPTGLLAPEDEVALATLAAQAAIAADNQRLLASARDQAALEAQLGEAHRRLSNRSNQLREVLVGQEDERHHLALRLHEDAAQAMAAILLGIRALERDLDSDAVRPRLEALHAHVDATLVDLRNLAVSLRPPVLDLGLDVALERLGEHRRAHGLERLDVSLDEALAAGARERETALYRVVEEALGAYDAPRRAAVTADEEAFVVTVVGCEGDHARPERVATLGARVELLGGTLEADRELRARIPLGPQRGA